MPVLVVANTKGGSGKSTTSIILGTTIARLGGTVRVIDVDPQGTSSKWSRGESKYNKILVPLGPGDDLVEMVDKLSTEYQFVIIDVQGSANQEIVGAVSRADLVIIPMRGTTADSDEAPKVLTLLKKHETLLRQKISRAVLFIATSAAIRTREEKEIRKELEDAGVPVFTNDLNLRTAFSHIFKYKLALDELDPQKTNGLEAAIENAQLLAAEIISAVRATHMEAEVTA